MSGLPTASPAPPPPNSAEARTPTGELKPVAPTITPTTSAEGQSKVASDAEVPKEDVSVLNKEPEVPKGAPEKYEDWKLPDGSSKDLPELKVAEEMFKKANLTQSQGQELLDAYFKNTQAAIDKLYTDFRNVRNQWVQQTKDWAGSNFETYRADISKALSVVTEGNEQLNSDFRRAMDITGAGDNPAFVRVFHALAKYVNEGKAVQGAGPSPLGQVRPGNSGRPTPAQSMYPNLPSAANPPQGG